MDAETDPQAVLLDSPADENEGREESARVLRGVAASPGCVEGIAFIYRQPGLDEIPRYVIAAANIETELTRFEKAVRRSAEELRAVRERVADEIGKSEADIFDAHLLFLEDPQLAERICVRVRNELINVEQALAEEIRQSMKLLGASRSDFMRERVLDLRDVGNRLVRNLMDRNGHSLLETLQPQSIVVAAELTPSDTIALDQIHMAGMATEKGGGTSHAAILARSMGIPAITGIAGLLQTVHGGARVLLDGVNGIFITNPSPGQIRRFASSRRQYETARLFIGTDAHTECVLRDGTSICLLANTGHCEDIASVRGNHLDGIGLYRSELRYLKDSESPSLAVQYHDYQLAATTLTPLPVTIRTFDFGPEKRPRFLDINSEASILKGLRGLRYALQEKQLIKVQLRALARVCREHSNVRILFPMVMGRSCLQEALALLDEQCVKEGLTRRPPVGAMIETPAAVFTLPDIVGLVDFVHIGSNDLAHYVLVEDRCQTRMEGYELTLHPAMLRAIQTVVDVTRQHKCPVCLCGEAAGDPIMAAVMVGLGVRSFSMSPVRAQGIRFALRRLSIEDANELVQFALSAHDPATLFSQARERFPAAFIGAHTPLARRNSVSAPAEVQ